MFFLHPVAEALEATGVIDKYFLYFLYIYKTKDKLCSLMSKGFMYILECSDGSYYTGSTKDLERRLWEHQHKLGANHTKKRLPVKLIYFEEYDRIDKAFYREKQVQGWRREKKEALMNGTPELLPKLAIAYRDLRNPGGFECQI